MWKCRRREHRYAAADLTLRPLLRRDIPAAVSAMNDEAARAMLMVKGTPEQLALRLSASMSATGDDPYRADYAIEVGRVVVGVRSLSELEPGVLITGSWLHADWRRRGLGTASLQAIRALAHDHLGYAQLLSATRPANAAALAMLDRAGMSLLSPAWPHVCDDGTTIPCVWYLSEAPPSRCG